ncbi:peroxiredoxin [Litoribacter ruber]|uniref:thioredoxin-dependent peroxiredoxin n=1 Tax=Litoribacter ruber TaxID=702568 RepID=A0AAP2CMF4_9BACT|nr:MULTISPECIES: peroxiredoxin [Litoribacter]MBS9525240.1 peroxiredoxin [Litoribacter alkaliphilus]MBT0811726.1 peroxiredoxin [Litoribacter ruber]
MALKIGQKAPDFSLPATGNKTISLSKDLQGQACILFFYPKDFTKGCTAEVCSFRNNYETFEIPVYGISKDSMESHEKFKKTHKLPYELLSDRSGKVCKQYGALMPIINMPKRVTYLLDSEHKIAAVFQDLFGAEKHIQKMIESMGKVVEK